MELEIHVLVWNESIEFGWICEVREGQWTLAADNLELFISERKIALIAVSKLTTGLWAKPFVDIIYHIANNAN